MEDALIPIVLMRRRRRMNWGVMHCPAWRLVALGVPPPGPLARSCVPTALAGQFLFEALHKAAQADAQHLTDIPELDQIQPAQPAFYVAGKRLRAVERFGEVALGQPCLDPTLFEQFQENQVFVSINRLFHRRHPSVDRTVTVYLTSRYLIFRFTRPSSREALWKMP